MATASISRRGWRRWPSRAASASPARVHDQVHGKIDVAFEDMGEQTAQEHRASRCASIACARRGRSASHRAPPLALPDKPSIAVLPFQNMSGDPEQEYFADGMVEEIITALSRMRWLFVIARNSSFTYKGRAVDVKQVGRELGVRYVLEGSVRKAGNRVRITGQLIDAATGAHLWADRFDGGLRGIFDLQDQVTASVVGAIAPKLEQAEIERAKRKPTESLDAYDYYLRGMAAVHQWTREGNDEALGACSTGPSSSIPNSPRPMAWRRAATRSARRWLDDRSRRGRSPRPRRLARRAAELGKDDAVALCTAGLALAFVVGDLDDGARPDRSGARAQSESGLGVAFSGWVKVWLGEPEVAIEHADAAMRLSPHDPHVFNMQSAMAYAHFFAGRYAEASSWAEMALRERPNHHSSLGMSWRQAAPWPGDRRRRGMP